MIGIWERVKHLMDVQRLSHYAVEKGIGVSPSQLSSWINNDRYPRADIALRLANYFNVSLMWLLTGEDANAIPPEHMRILRNKELMDMVKRLELCNMRQSNAIQAILDAFDL